MTERIESVIAALERLLDEERGLLRAGRIADLQPLSERKLDLLRQLGAAALPAPVAARLRDGLTRNAGLIGAAAQGLRDVQTRLRQFAEGPGLTTYGPGGRRRAIDAQAPSVTRNV